MSQVTINYDVIIIGAGISGLVCGCYLAKAGMKILIVEQHDKPGGYFTSFKKKGFLFDAAAHSFGNYREGGCVRKVFTELGVDKILKIKRFDPSDIIITPDFKITFWNDKKRTMAELANIFPEEKKNINNFFDFLTSENQFELGNLKNTTFSSLLRSFFKNEKLINLIAAPVFGGGGLPPSLMPSFIGSKIFRELILDGGYYSEGGIQNLPNALDYIIKQNKGTILYKRFVKKILCKDSKAIGVKLENDEVLISKYVVSACDMTQTFKTFLGESVVGDQVNNKLNNMIPSLSFFILYIGIKNFFNGLPSEGTNMWYFPNTDLDNVYRNIKQCDFEKAGMYLLRVSPDQKTLSVSSLAPFKTRSFWKHHKKNIAQNFLNKTEKLVPNLKKHIVYFDAATPATLFRYTLNYKGAAFGWAKTFSQIFDPIFCRATFMDGLYFTGHWTSIGFGMPGACYSGFDAGNRILRKEKINGCLHFHGSERLRL